MRLNDTDVIGVLEKFSSYLDAPVQKEYGMASLKFHNANGKGELVAYNIFPGLAAITFDMKLAKDTQLVIGESPQNPVYFVFCLEGNMQHKFSEGDSLEKIHFQQNVILSSSDKRRDYFRIPGNTPLKVSLICLFRDGIPEDGKTNANYLRTGLDDIFEDIRDDQPYKYFGHILPKTAGHVELLIDNQQTGIAGRLLTEASILNILATQLIGHDEEKSFPVLNSQLAKEDLVKVAEMAKYIAQNLSEDLSIGSLKDKSGLSPKKLQNGFKHLYGQSVYNYIRNARLERARELIETTNQTISEIVYQLGISNRSNFSNNFRDRYGLLPTAYRKMIQNRS